MGGRSSLPTLGERSNIDSSGPSSLLWSPWLELGEENNQVLVLRLNTNPELISQISQLRTCIRLSYCSLSLKHLPYSFPFFPNEFLEVHSSWMILLLEKYLSSLNSLHWALLKDCLGIFGLVVIYLATCSDPTFLGDHDHHQTSHGTSSSYFDYAVKG